MMYKELSIPESYKQWLRFSGDYTIDGTVASFFSPKNFRTEYVPEDLVVIGEQIGDGEVVCFSKETGEIISFLEGRINYEYGTFNKTLKEVIRLMGKPEEVREETELERLERERNNVLRNLEKHPKDRDLCLEIIEELDERIKALGRL